MTYDKIFKGKTGGYESDEDFIWRVCGKKKNYKSEKTAGNAIKTLKKKGLIVPSNAHGYLCPHCEFYHIGHSKDEDA